MVTWKAGREGVIELLSDPRGFRPPRRMSGKNLFLFFQLYHIQYAHQYESFHLHFFLVRLIVRHGSLLSFWVSHLMQLEELDSLILILVRTGGFPHSSNVHYSLGLKTVLTRAKLQNILESWDRQELCSFEVCTRKVFN